jgi:Protein of unknown function (DUF2889)
MSVEPDDPEPVASVPAPLPFPSAHETYRRTIDLHPAIGVIEAEVEDYLHHFTVRLTHDGCRVTEATATAVRSPWHSCPVGAAGVRALAGTELAVAGQSRAWVTDRSEHCLHVLDLATVAAAHALDHEPTRYEIVVTPAGGRERVATMRRDGGLLLRWEMDGSTITGPGRFTGVSLERGPFLSWMRAELEPGEYEPVLVMRRACSIAYSRGIDLDAYAYASDTQPVDASCYTFRPDVAFTARRNRGTARATELTSG